MKRLVLFLVVCLALYSQNAYAQENGVEYPRFKIQLESGEYIEGKDGYFASSVFKGVSKDGEKISVGKSAISSIKVPSGSKAAEGALIGAGIGLVLTGLTASSLTAGPNPDNYYSYEPVIPIIAGATCIFALLGSLHGATQTKWKEVPISTTFNFGVQEKGVSLSVSIPFD